jgi:hypothetical protein
LCYRAAAVAGRTGTQWSVVVRAVQLAVLGRCHFFYYSCRPGPSFYNKSNSYRVGRGLEPPETIVDKSALNCGQGLRPETAY